MAVLLLADFRVRFPEFSQSTDAFLQAYLDIAADRVTAFPEHSQGIAQGFLAAHLIVQSPHGRHARQTDKEAASTYHSQYLRLLKNAKRGGVLL